MADDLDPAAVEQPTAAQVLAAHGACYGGSDEAYAVTCSCDRYGRPMGYAGLDGVKVHAAHQADMLAAAGLLVTPEHDAQVAARALREAAALRRGPDQYGVESVPAQWIEDMAAVCEGNDGLTDPERAELARQYRESVLRDAADTVLREVSRVWPFHRWPDVREAAEYAAEVLRAEAREASS